MSLSKYDVEYIPQPCGLRNSGAICYLNSMLQVLLSCSAFNQYMLENRDEYEELAKTGNKLGMSYIKLLDDCDIQYADSANFKIKVNNGSSILRELIVARQKNEFKSNLLHHRQEDFHEGLTFFIETLALDDSERESGVSDIFSIRYRLKIQCRQCKYNKDGPKAPPNVMFNLFEEDPVLQDALNSKEAIENYIKRHVNIPEDYKCDKCKAENKVVSKKVTRNVLQVYSLARLSDVIILVFNKYFVKKEKYFPLALDFPSRDGNLHYEVVSQVEHYGNQRGGHYLVKCRRPKPVGLDEFIRGNQKEPLERQMQTLEKRRALWTKKVKAEQNKIDTGTSRNKAASERTVRNLGIKLRALEKEVVNTRNALDKLVASATKTASTTQENVVFHLNDTQVAIDPKGFRPTKNTYMVIYHLT